MANRADAFSFHAEPKAGQDGQRDHRAAEGDFPAQCRAAGSSVVPNGPSGCTTGHLSRPGPLRRYCPRSASSCAPHNDRGVALYGAAAGKPSKLGRTAPEETRGPWAYCDAQHHVTRRTQTAATLPPAQKLRPVATSGLRGTLRNSPRNASGSLSGRWARGRDRVADVVGMVPPPFTPPGKAHTFPSGK